MSRAVILVAGPPCSGKTTHVQQHAKPGDLVLDQDVIGAAAMRQGLAQVATMTTGTAWVIRCCPGPQRRAAFARQIGATDTVLLTAPAEELIARATHRPNPRRHIQAVRDWLRREAEDAPVRSPAGAVRKPRPASRDQAYNWEHRRARAKALAELLPDTPCPYCGESMDRNQQLDYDHALPLAYDPSGQGPRRLAHATCNRRAGQAIGVAVRKAKRASLKPSQRVINSRAW